MKIFKLLILLFALTISSMAKEGIINPFLWEVKKGEQSFFIFGTMHLGDPKLQTLPKALKIAIDKGGITEKFIPIYMVPSQHRSYVSPIESVISFLGIY